MDRCCRLFVSGTRGGAERGNGRGRILTGRFTPETPQPSGLAHRILCCPSSFYHWLRTIRPQYDRICYNKQGSIQLPFDQISGQMLPVQESQKKQSAMEFKET